MQRFAAGHQQCQTRAARHQLGDELHCAEYLLEVVEDHEHSALCEHLGQDGLERLAAGLLNADGLRDAGGHERGVLDGGQVDEGHAVGELGLQTRSRGAGDSGLARTARAGQRQQPNTLA